MLQRSSRHKNAFLYFSDSVSYKNCPGMMKVICAGKMRRNNSCERPLSIHVLNRSTCLPLLLLLLLLLFYCSPSIPGLFRKMQRHIHLHTDTHWSVNAKRLFWFCLCRALFISELGRFVSLEEAQNMALRICWSSHV